MFHVIPQQPSPKPGLNSPGVSAERTERPSGLFLFTTWFENIHYSDNLTGDKFFDINIVFETPDFQCSDLDLLKLANLQFLAHIFISCSWPRYSRKVLWRS